METRCYRRGTGESGMEDKVRYKATMKKRYMVKYSILFCGLMRQT